MKYRNKTKSTLFIATLLCSLTALFLQAPISTNAQSSITSTCIDTIAGYSALCKTSVTAPNTEIQFKLTKPDTSVIRFPCVTNLEGIASCDINYFHTTTAGIYKIGAYLSGYAEPADIQEALFKVFPDTISSVTSAFKASKLSVAADGVDSSYLTVQLKDKHGNAIANHKVEILSSRDEDRIEKIQSDVSNQDGKVNFKVISKTPGISTFIARDAFSGITLTERAKVVFYQGTTSYTPSSTSSFSQGLKTDIFATKAIGGTATSLKIEAPEQVQQGIPFDVSVQVLDSNGSPALSYRGTIFFSTTGDSNASLPLQNEGYTFKGTDENASHTFTKATSFSTTGTHRLLVTDVDNPDMEAEKIITVSSGSAPVSNTNSSLPSSTLQITTPSAGSTYGESTVNIMGSMSAFTKFVVSDTGVQLGDGMSDTDGKFLFQAKGLSDGKHAFIVTALDANNAIIAKSSEVIVFVDTKSAVLKKLTILPSNTVGANTPIQIVLESEPKLSKARIIINQVAYDLLEDTTTPGTYKGTMNAPDKEGEYEIKAALVNTLGQESSPATNQKLIVSASSSSAITGLKTSEGTVSGSVTLTWNSLPDTFTTFKEYNIYYDTNPLSLQNKLVSKDKTSTFTVTGLDSNATYYFSVSMTDVSGSETQKSDIIPGTPAKNGVAGNTLSNVKTVSEDSKITFSWDDPQKSEIVRYSIEYGIHSGEYLEKVYTKDNKTTWYIPDLINGMEYYFKISGVDQNNAVVLSSDEIQATAGGEQYHKSACTAEDVQNLHIVTRGDERILVWDPVPGVFTYRVYAGTQQGVFNLPTRDVRGTYFSIPYLNAKNTYYFFAVKAVCDDTLHESANFSNVLKVNVGPEAFVIAGVSFVMVGAGWVWRRKRRNI